MTKDSTNLNRWKLLSLCVFVDHAIQVSMLILRISISTSQRSQTLGTILREILLTKVAAEVSGVDDLYKDQDQSKRPKGRR